MTNEFPANSHSQKPSSQRYEKTADGEERPKLEKVVVGEVKTVKRGFGRRLADNVFRGDGVLAYIGKEVLLPAFQNLMVDAVTEGIGRLVKGDEYDPRTNRYRGSGSFRGAPGYHDYTARSNPGPATRGPATRHNAFHQGSNRIDSISVDTRAEAEIICEQMDATLGRYGSVTRANLNELLDRTSIYTDYKWGWTDLREMGFRRYSGGYEIFFPPLEDLEPGR